MTANCFSAMLTSLERPASCGSSRRLIGAAYDPSIAQDENHHSAAAGDAGLLHALLGLRLVEEWDETDDARCILTFNADEPIAFLEIYRGAGEHDYSGLSLQFRTEDLGVQGQVPADVEVRGPVTRPWGSTYLYLADPNGISVVVFEGGF